MSEYAVANVESMSKSYVFADLIERAHSAALFVLGPVDQGSDARLYERAGTHGAGFRG